MHPSPIADKFSPVFPSFLYFIKGEFAVEDTCTQKIFFLPGGIKKLELKPVPAGNGYAQFTRGHTKPTRLQ
jgi:hypothetical protein